MAIIKEQIEHCFGKPPEKQKRLKDNTTHRNMCIRASQWLRGTMGCNVAVWEVVACAAEKPDAIGWHPFKSTLVECKTNRADFLRDAKKYHKKTTDSGMGNYRYYMCPPDVIKLEDLPECWGLLYLEGNRIRIIKRAEYQDANLSTERTFLASILRRKLEGCPYIDKKLTTQEKDTRDDTNR